MADKTPSAKWRWWAWTWAGLALISFVMAGQISYDYFQGSNVPDTPPPPPQSSIDMALVTFAISAVTCFVSTVSAVSAMFLAWRADRRAEREQAFKLQQGDPKS